MNRETLIELKNAAVHAIYGSTALAHWLAETWDVPADRDFPTQDMYDRGALSNLAAIEWAQRSYGDVFHQAEVYLADPRGPRRILGEWCTSIHEAAFSALPNRVYDRISELIDQNPHYESFDERYPLDEVGRRPQRLLDDLRRALLTRRQDAYSSLALAELVEIDTSELCSRLVTETARALKHLPIPIAQATNGTPAMPAGEEAARVASGMSWEHAKRKAEEQVKRTGWPDISLTQWADLIGCSRATLKKAIDNSTPLTARKAEAEGRPVPDGVQLALTIAEQEHDRQREERQAIAARRRRGRARARDPEERPV
jgi:hypothetical protein